MKPIPTALCAVAICLAVSSSACAQTKPSLHCVSDQLSEAQRQVIGDASLSGVDQDKASALMEGATASCATKYTPTQMNAAVEYATNLSTLAAANARLKDLGAPGLVDAVWAKSADHRKDVLNSLKAGAPTPYVLGLLTDAAPKGSADGQAIAISGLMGLTAKAAVEAADSGG